MIYLYIIKCADNSYYTGITSNINRRLYQHNNRIKSCLQKNKVPIKLVYSHIYNTRIKAAQKEKEIKGWSREKKEKLIYNIQINTT